MRNRFLLSVLALLVFSVAVTVAQPRRITTAKAPAMLFAEPAAGRIHVLTIGVDVNFNGVLEPDSGDVPARWLVLDAASETVVDSATFPGFNIFPLRAGVDLRNNLLYLQQLGRVRAYDIRTLRQVRDSVLVGSYSAVSLDTAANCLIVAERRGSSAPGVITIVDLDKGDTLARVRAGINTAMSVALADRRGGDAYYTINEGGFGAGNASVSATLLRPDVYDVVNNDTMSGGASFITERGGRVYVALGGGHRVHVLNAATGRDVPYSPIAFGNVRRDGPRTLAFQDDSTLIIGTYAAQLIRVRTTTGAILDTIAMRGKVEAIAVRDSLAYVAIRSVRDTTLADSVLQVVNLRSGAITRTVAAAREPLALFFSANGDLHVVANGEAARAWLVYDANLTLKETRSFGTMPLDNPFRVVYDAASDSAYAVIADTVRAIGVAGGGPWRTVYAGTRKTGRLNSVSEGGEYLIVCEALTAPTGPEYVHVITRGGDLVAKFKTSPRPLMAARVPGSRPGAVRLYVLDRAVAGQIRSQLDMFEFHPNILNADTLGDGANHIVGLGDRVLVTMNGGHSVAVVDANTGLVAAKLPIGTTGFDGPRELQMLPGGISLVTTYAGDLRVVSRDGGIQTHPIGGKAEGVTMLGSKVFVASIFAPDYSADSAVVVFDAAAINVASVRREDVVASALSLEQNQPNPVGEATVIRFSVERAGRAELAVFDMTGRRVATLLDRDVEAGTYAVDVRVGDLPGGVYVYRLVSGAAVQSRTMQVVR